ncbi:hypothetical protein LP419_19085 [Massilia sp. H-1]|nr:hypothetical protein LP419_19085 [Massilia sp. H-1]
MRLFSGNYRLLGWITLILVGGFVTTSAAAYLASRDAIEHSISEQALPLTGDLIYSGLQKDILYPVFVASMMAQDPAVHDWLADGEKDEAYITRYLEETRDRHGMVASFLASDATRKLYHTYGAPEPLVEGRDIDKWYFRLKSLPRYESSIDIATEYSGQPSLFINHRVTDAMAPLHQARPGSRSGSTPSTRCWRAIRSATGARFILSAATARSCCQGATKGGAETLAQRSGMRRHRASHPQPQHRTDQPGLPQRQVGRAGQFALCAGSELVPGGQNRTRAAPSARSRASSRSISASASASRCWC